MKNKFCLLFVLFVGLFLFNTQRLEAASDIGIYIEETEHTVVFPYEKSFRAIAKIINHSDEVKTVRVNPQGDMPEGGHLLIPVGEYKLDPGQEAHLVVVFEVGNPPPNKQEVLNKDMQDSEVKIPIVFTWEGGEESYEFTIKNKTLPFREKKDGLSNVKFDVLDKDNNEKIEGALITALLPSGMEFITANYQDDQYELDLPSGEYLEDLKNEYKIDLESTGYFLQVAKDGYESYFKSDFLPKEGEDKRTLSLTPINKIGKYKFSKTVRSGYSVWWIRSSQDEKYIAISQGAHGQEGIEPPSYSKILLLTNEGELIWEKETGGECWGMDISPDGEYIAAGCHDGKIYLWNRDGEKLWEYVNERSMQVRWVKFSPNNKYLLAGPVNTIPEESGVFDVESGNLKWSYYTGDWLRAGEFSSDSSIAYFDSANGIIHALDTENGDLEWVGNGDHYIPFLFHLSENTKQIYVTGKGLAFTALEMNTGKFRWQTPVDQTVTAAQAANDGSIVGVTVGGMIYKLNREGEIAWARFYGGVGHNGVHYTNSGKYILLGGPNPTLLDANGNILWQRDPDEEIDMSGPAEQWTGGANDVWMSEDASLLVLGQDDGDIQFYQGEINEGRNDLSQVIGPYAGDIKKDKGGIFDNFRFGQKEKDRNINKERDQLPPWQFLVALGSLIILTIVIVLVVVKIKKNKHEGEN